MFDFRWLNRRVQIFALKPRGVEGETKRWPRWNKMKMKRGMNTRPNAFQLLSPGMKMFVRPSSQTRKKRKKTDIKWKVGSWNGWHSEKVAQLVAPSTRCDNGKSQHYRNSWANFQVTSEFRWLPIPPTHSTPLPSCHPNFRPDCDTSMSGHYRRPLDTG